jgi:ribose transport system substrate-binding protein
VKKLVIFIMIGVFVLSLVSCGPQPTPCPECPECPPCPEAGECPECPECECPPCPEAPAAASLEGEWWNEPYTASQEWVLGVSYQNLAFPYVAAMQKAIQNKAKEVGVKIIETDAYNDTNKELANVENMLAQDIDLLLFEAASLEASVASIEAANQAGVPVVQFNGLAEGGEWITFVGSNQIESGYLLGEWLLMLYDDLGKDQLKGIYLRGVAGQITDVWRSKGVMEKLEEAGMLDKFEFVEQHADYDRGKGQTVTESILSKSQDYDFIIANNDDMILGGLAVVREMGLDKIRLCGVDGLPEALEAIKAGELDATVFQNPEGQAAGGLLVAVQYLDGQTFPKEIMIPFELVTPENVDKIMEVANRVYIK